MDVCKSGRHKIRGPQDLRPNGRNECIHCSRERQQRYRQKRQAALDLVRLMEAQGFNTDPETMGWKPAEGLAQDSEAIADEMVSRWGGDVE